MSKSLKKLQEKIGTNADGSSVNKPPPNISVVEIVCQQSNKQFTRAMVYIIEVPKR